MLDLIQIPFRLILFDETSQSTWSSQSLRVLDINVSSSSQYKLAETFVQIIVGSVGNIIGVLGSVQFHAGLVGGVRIVQMAHQDTSWTSGLSVVDDGQELTGDWAWSSRGDDGAPVGQSSDSWSSQGVIVEDAWTTNAGSGREERLRVCHRLGLLDGCSSLLLLRRLDQFMSLSLAGIELLPDEN